MALYYCTIYIFPQHIQNVNSLQIFCWSDLMPFNANEDNKIIILLLFITLLCMRCAQDEII